MSEETAALTEGKRMYVTFRLAESLDLMAHVGPIYITDPITIVWNREAVGGAGWQVAGPEGEIVAQGTPDDSQTTVVLDYLRKRLVG